MCGIAAVLFPGATGPLGAYLLQMLYALEHRGRDSAGVAVYSNGNHRNTIRVRMLTRDVIGALAKITTAIAGVGGNIRNIKLNLHSSSGYSYDYYELEYSGSTRRLAEAIDSTGLARVVSIGRSADVIKHVVTVEELDRIFEVSRLDGSHGLGHVRFSTESGVDPFRAHPFQDLDDPDVVVVHNGQITNYWKVRDRLELKGIRFATDNDSELIVHYIAYKMRSGLTLYEALKHSVRELDGPFAYIIATPAGIGMARDRLGLRPLVVGQSPDVLAVASEEGAIRSLELAYELRLKKRYLNPGEVLVWELKG